MFIGLWPLLILLAGVLMMIVMMRSADRDGVVHEQSEHPGYPARSGQPPE